jgi:hypothetical protein
METLVCTIIVDNARIIVVSPLIGRLKLSVSTGQLLGPSQVIGTAMRLNRHFVIKLPAEIAVATIAAITSADRVIAVEFGEHVMELQVVGEDRSHARAGPAKKRCEHVGGCAHGRHVLSRRVA